ncbi:MAG: tRNA lysidine(34) synthetase TilS [bacterium]
MARFVKKIQNFSFENNLWEKNSKIIVGVSGGSDSACLLNILNILKDKYNFDLHVAHVNYGLRGKDSDQDEAFVKKIAKAYDMAVSVLRPKKSQYKGNLENSLREIRYDFFEKLRKKNNFDLIAVAHNQDDQAETVLMRIIRGSGLNGIGAMRAKSGNIIRPLLETSKADVLLYMKENKLKYQTDKTNFDFKFTRNSIRHGLLPYLEKNFNPKIKETLSGWSHMVSNDYDFIDRNAQSFAELKHKNKCSNFLVSEFFQMHPSLQCQALKIIGKKLKGDNFNLENSQVSEIIKVIKSEKNKSQKASIGGLNISKKGAKVDIRC